MELELLKKKYSNLLIRTGLDVQINQKLIIEAPVETYEFVRMIVKEAYHQGAKEVIVHYVDNNNLKEKANNLTIEEVMRVSDWEEASLNEYLEDGACSLLIASPNPYLMSDVAEDKAHALSKYTNDKRNLIRSKIASDGIQWCIAAVPNQEWAEVVMPDVAKENALREMWKLILKLVYVDEENDPNKTWEKKSDQRGVLREKLSNLDLDSIRMTSSNGTDITFGFVDSCTFGGRNKESVGPNYHPNIPTEEICTSPDKYRTNGIVYSTKPLLIGGKIVENFALTFKEGKVVDIKCEDGYELLKKIIETDEGSCYLGEVAFVEYHSPISLSNRVFYNTLIDENASCHLALGRGFPGCVQASPTDKEDWANKHLNDSSIHVDFMVGSKDTGIVGYTKDGKTVEIFKDGDYCL